MYNFGFMFENLCLRDLAVSAGFYGGNIYHYHDNSELEVDAIVEMPDGSWGAFEIKLGEEIHDFATQMWIASVKAFVIHHHQAKAWRLAYY